MRVLEVELSRFMSSAPTRLRLPRAGVVVVTGANGAGKSSLLEGVSVALFGRTLRGTPWWPSANASGKVDDRLQSSARVVTDVVLAERVRKGSKSALTWSVNEGEDAGRVVRSTWLLRGPNGAPTTEHQNGAPVAAALGEPSGPAPAVYETVTQAQEALEEVIGTFDAWRRTRVFSSADAAHLSGASDGERKRFLESMFGLERFDAALREVRADLKQAEEAFTQARGAQVEASAKLLGLQGRLEQAEFELTRARAAVPELSEQEGEALTSPADLDEAVRGARAWVSDADAAYHAAATALSRADLALEQATRAVERYARGECPTCGQSAGHILAAEREGHDAATSHRGVAFREFQVALASKDEARSVVEGLIKQRQAREVSKAAAAALAQARRRAESRVAQVEAEVGDLAHAVADLRAGVEEAAQRVEVARLRVQMLQAATVALGLRGFRAHLLSKSLSGLTTLANAWLPRLGMPGLAVQLRPYTEKKSGEVSDAISLEVEGAGDGYGYRAASQGERRRVDVSLLLATAEVGQAAAAQTGSTLFFDEAFDALDADGVEALALALEDLARDRCVVVISHNQDVISGVRAAMRVRVSGGVCNVEGGERG